MASEDEIRDRFAEAAMQVIIPQGMFGQFINMMYPAIDFGRWGGDRRVAFEAYMFADAMMEERQRRLTRKTYSPTLEEQPNEL